MPEPEFRLIHYRGLFAVAFYDKSGRHRVSTGTSDQALAKSFLRKFIRDYEEAARPSRITVEYAWTGYRQTLDGRPSHATTGFEWKSVGPHFGHLWADDVTEADCLSYTVKRRAQGRSDGTIWTELGRLRMALRWAESKNLIVKAPAIKRPTPPPPRDLRMTREQVKQFLTACDLRHVKLFVILAMTTGARMGALLELEWEQVDFERGVIHLAKPGRATSNKGRAQVPMNATSRAALSAARQEATTDFVVEWGGHGLHDIAKALRNAGARCGLPWVTAHVFRHSAASQMAEAGVPMDEIAQYLGHRDAKITARVYARFSPAYLRGAASALEIDFAGKRSLDHANQVVPFKAPEGAKKTGEDER